MGKEDVLESYIEDINSLLDTIRLVTKKVRSAKDGNSKIEASKEAEEPIQEIEEIFSKRYVERTISACGDRAKEFRDKRNELEEQFESLKKNLKESVDVGGKGEVQPVSRTERKPVVEDPDAQLRIQEKAERRKLEVKQIEEKKELEKEQPDEIDKIKGVQKNTLDALARAKGINIETLKIADRIGQKLVEQTEQMERIQAKLDELGDGIGRAKKEVGAVMRGIATDKIIMGIICCIVFVGIIIVCVRVGYGIYQRVSGVASLFPTSTPQKAPTSSSSASIVFKHTGGNVFWNNQK